MIGAPRRTFAIPALLALATAAGLFAALLGDGAADWLAWAGLGAPVAATAWARGTRKTHESRSRRPHKREART